MDYYHHITYTLALERGRRRRSRGGSNSEKVARAESSRVGGCWRCSLTCEMQHEDDDNDDEEHHDEVCDAWNGFCIRGTQVGGSNSKVVSTVLL